jgi:hypothetical protein
VIELQSLQIQTASMSNSEGIEEKDDDDHAEIDDEEVSVVLRITS